MTQQELNGAHVGAGFKQMDRKGVPKRVWCNGFGNAAKPTCFLTRLFDGILAYVLVGDISGKKPVLRTGDSPPVPQSRQQLWREHDVAILLSFALLNSNNHSLAIDVGRFQPDGF